MKIDISLWDNNRRMRERIRNLGTMVLSLSAVNGFYYVRESLWFLFAINFLFFVTVLPVFVSYSKWQKEPPKVEVKDGSEK